MMSRAGMRAWEVVRTHALAPLDRQYKSAPHLAGAAVPH
jgi:hypothetical protein